ncbi:MAG: DUF2892 domain-containing protein [Polyangiaceae bacterium]
MKKNLGSLDRAARGAGALAAFVTALVLGLPTIARLGLVATGVYLVYTALAGTCLGYRMMGLSTCPTKR